MEIANGQQSRTTQEAMSALVSALHARGLVAKFVGQEAVRVKNPAGAPDKNEKLGQLLSPGMQQEVTCRPLDGDGELWWFWSWPGPERHSAPELEPLCPAVEAEVAAARIASVLAVPFVASPDVPRNEH